MLNAVHQLTPANLLVGQGGFPAIIEQENGDGTVQGRVDLAQASSAQKLAALADFKFGAAKELLGL